MEADPYVLKWLHQHPRIFPMGTLYVVSTPIGNLEDITLRAIRVLKEASLIAAEDTRHTGRLLKHFEIETPQISYFEHNKLARQDVILHRLSEGDVALVSDAGTPGLSDPGYELIGAAIEAGFPVVAIPGASALLAALVVSGLPTDRFLYAGFLPRRRSDRRQQLESLRDQTVTLIFYEAPHRVKEALADMLEVFGDRPAVVCREITKLHEETLRDGLAGAVQWFDEHEPRGEFTIVVSGATEAELTPGIDPEILLRRYLAEGLSSKSAIQRVAGETGLPRRRIYDLYLSISSEIQPN
jgi:16S rRNA (cytidine1402-2'-O)-methyltransferase